MKWDIGPAYLHQRDGNNGKLPLQPPIRQNSRSRMTTKQKQLIQKESHTINDAFIVLDLEPIRLESCNVTAFLETNQKVSPSSPPDSQTIRDMSPVMPVRCTSQTED